MARLVKRVKAKLDPLEASLAQSVYMGLSDRWTEPDVTVSPHVMVTLAALCVACEAGGAGRTVDAVLAELGDLAREFLRLAKPPER